MNQKKKHQFQAVMSLFIVAIVFFMTFINTSEFKKDYTDSAAENNYIILDSIVERIEYGIRYGKRLDNYYDIDNIFADLETYCETDQYFITDMNGERLYGKEIPEWFSDELVRLAADDSDYTVLTEGKTTGILTKIMNGEETIGFAGIFYQMDNTDKVTGSYVQWMYLFAGIVSLIGIFVFLLLFRLVKHEWNAGKLTGILLPLIIVLNIAAVGNSYFVLHDGYTAITDEVAQKLLEKNTDDITRLIEAGVNYGDISQTEEYYEEITEQVEQLESIRLVMQEEEGFINRELPEDSTGEKGYLSVMVSQEYVNRRVRSALINVVVAAVTEVMIASELLSFLVGLLVKPHDSRKKKRETDGKVSLEHIEVVRGLSFFFAAFRYMSMAFMTVVLAEIYKPIVVFGYTIPYELVMSFPLSAQVFISMITSYISGAITNKRGWKAVSLFGVFVMCIGTLLSAFAKAPIPFILAQMVVGTGLGFAKMGIDIYAVAVASEEDMSAYTSGSNASLIVGLSSSSLIGALFADTFGYSGAYLAMTAVGLLVMVLVFLFGQDVIPQAGKKEETPNHTVKNTEKRDSRFGAYLLFMIIPYFFIMMFVDYFFPVYAVEQGVTVDEIGYVTLFYGIATAYIGAKLCDRLMKRMQPVLLMAVIMFILAGSIFLFSVRNYVPFAVLIVLLIGVADGIMPSAQFDYLYHLPISQKIGFSWALGIEGFFSSLIGAAAPMVFSIVMMQGNGGLAVVAVVVCICALLFITINGKKKFRAQSVGLILVCVVLTSWLSGDLVYAGKTGNTGEKLVIGYCQAESYYEFDYQLYDIMLGMQERGDITADMEGLYEGIESRKLWERLSLAESDCYEFPAEGFIDYSDSAYADLSEEEIAKRIQEIIRENDIDLMLTMGTSAGIMIMEHTDADYMNFLASDPIGSQIVLGEEYSGTDRGWAHVNSGVDERALAVMEDLFAPQKLGIVYNTDDPAAYIYSSAQAVDKYAELQGVAVETISVSDNFAETPEAYAEYVNDMKMAHEQLANEGIDVYIMTTSLLEPEDFNVVLAPLVEKGIPVFSVNSTEDVRYGATAAVEMLDYPNIGRFAAETIKRYAEGKPLEELNQKYDTAPFLVLNIDTLQRSKIQLPLYVLLSASNIYQNYTGEAR